MLNDIKFLCQKYNLQPKSWKGQNFLIDHKILDKIIEAADLKKDDLILEVGPGFGILTQALAKRVKKVIAVEIDKNIIRALKDILKDFKNVEIIEGDILKFSIFNFQFSNNFKIVANIPYSITGIFLRKFLENKIKPEEMVLLVQKEVAERITAKPGKMSLLSAAVQFYSQPEIISLVSKKSFYPEPKVDSAIIRLKIKNQEPKIDEKVFFKIVKMGFSSRRKQLHNNLAVGLKMSNKEIKEIFKKLNFNPKIRAQDLSVEDWIKVSEGL